MSHHIESDMERKRKRNAYDSESVEYVSTSKVEVDTFAFIWSIQNFSTLADEKEICSPLYRGGPKTNHSWQLIVEPNKVDEADVSSDNEDDEEPEKYLGISLALQKIGGVDQSAMNKVIKASYQISLLDPDDKPKMQLGSSSAYDDFRIHWENQFGWDSFISMHKLLDPPERFVVEDTLKIHCRIWIQCGLKHSISSGGMVTETSTKEAFHTGQLQQLGLNLKSGLETASFADLLLVTKTNTFQAHKFVLSSRSRVFQAMFESQMREAIQNSVEIPDFDADVVRAMLEYMYCGQTKVVVKNASDLLRIADKYDLPGLKDECQDVLGNNLKIENSSKFLVLAHMHSATQLKTKTLSFINRNKKKIRETEGFKELEQADPSLFQELYLSQS